MMRQSLWSAFLAVILMSTVPVTIKWISASELEIGAVRLLIAALGLGLWISLKNGWPKLTAHQWKMLILLGLTFAVHWFTYFKSIKLSTPSIAAIGVSTYGIHLTLLSRIFLKQKAHWLGYCALAIAIIGLYVLMPEFNWLSDYFWGLVLGVVSGVLYACLPMIHAKSSDISHSMRAFGQFFFALVPFALFASSESWILHANDWYGLIFLGVIATLLAHSLWVKATTELPGYICSVIYYLYIPMTMTISVIVIDEPLSLSMIIGASIIVAANVLTLIGQKLNSLK